MKRWRAGLSGARTPPLSFSRSSMRSCSSSSRVAPLGAPVCRPTRATRPPDEHPVWCGRDRLQEQGLGGVVDHGRVRVEHVRPEDDVDFGRSVRSEEGVHHATTTPELTGVDSAASRARRQPRPLRPCDRARHGREQVRAGRSKKRRSDTGHSAEPLDSLGRILPASMTEAKCRRGPANDTRLTRGSRVDLQRRRTFRAAVRCSRWLGFGPTRSV